MILAAVAMFYGTLSACQTQSTGGSCNFQYSTQGYSEKRDCGVHKFKKMDGSELQITINCTNKKAPD